jgi:tRNA nucleotidyltransferase (CCA-adding enzyme)
MEPGATERRAKKLKAPNDYAALARLVATVVPAMESARSLDAENILALLDAADAWRRPERFATLLDTLGCVLCGDSADNVEALRRALEAASAINAQSLMAEGFAGKALGEAIHRERLQRIQNTLQSI